jgi:hypothetical protein
MKRKIVSGIESIIVNMKYMKVNITSIDEIITGMDLVKINPTDPWEILQENYSKLLTLHQTVISNENKWSPKFYKFMDSMDIDTIQYLGEIDFDDPTSGYKIECYIVRNLLEQSLKETDLLKKLEIVLKAYEILIVIVEEIRNEKFKPIISNIDLNNFKPLKRVKKFF